MKKQLMVLVGMLVMLVSSFAAADPVGGDKFDTDVVLPGGRTTYKVMCREDEMTRFKVEGDGDGDIDCYLYDGGMNMISYDESNRDGCVLDVVPRWTGNFYLVVKNNGRIADRYTFQAF